MACGVNYKNRYYKSSLVLYSNTDQTFNPSVPTTGQTLTYTSIGSNTGCAFTNETNGIQVNYNGLYSVSADVTLQTIAGPGTLTVQIFRDGVALPCCSAQVSQVVNDIDTLHVGTTVPVNVNASGPVTFTVVVSSTDVTSVTVSHAKMEMLKQA